jgi:hypothetical protein
MKKAIEELRITQAQMMTERERLNQVFSIINEQQKQRLYEICSRYCHGF